MATSNFSLYLCSFFSPNISLSHGMIQENQFAPETRGLEANSNEMRHSNFHFCFPTLISILSLLFLSLYHFGLFVGGGGEKVSLQTGCAGEATVYVRWSFLI